MSDYLIEKFNAEMHGIADKEAKALAGALDMYLSAVRAITDQAVLERMEAAVKNESLMSARNREFHNGPPKPNETPLEIAESRCNYCHGLGIMDDGEDCDKCAIRKSLEGTTP